MTAPAKTTEPKPWGDYTVAEQQQLFLHFIEQLGVIARELHSQETK